MMSKLLVYLTVIAAILGISRYVWHGLKSSFIKVFNLHETWSGLLRSVADMAETLKLILSRLDGGQKVMTELQEQTTKNTEHIAHIKEDVKGVVSRIERLEER